MTKLEINLWNNIYNLTLSEVVYNENDVSLTDDNDEPKTEFLFSDADLLQLRKDGWL